MGTKILTRYGLLLPVLAIALWYAHANAFMQDDAYISFNYAKWFSRGYGLVWYPGSTEYGYTNFLYTFMIGVAMLAGIPPEFASNSINTLSMVGTLVVGYALSTRILGSRMLAVLPMLLLATHPTFTAYATGGLETMFTTFLISLFYWQVLAAEGQNRETLCLRLGTIAAIALLTRLDSALLLFPGYVYMYLRGMKGLHYKQLLGTLWELREAVIIPVAALVSLFACCYLSYGYILPNTFYVKMLAGESGRSLYGLHYLILYNTLHAYLPLGVPVLLGYFFFRPKHLRAFNRAFFLLAATMMLWLSYVIYIGGDFMEFRMLLPVMLFYNVLLFRVILVVTPKKKSVVALSVFIAFLLSNSLHSGLFASRKDVLDFNHVPRRFDYAFVESADTLNEWISVRNVNWKIIGKRLNELFYNAPVKMIVATGNVGAISYFSDLNIFDVLGLNSRATLKNYNGSKLSNYNYEIKRPGHSMVASDPVLEEAGVNLNLAFPQAVCMRMNTYTWSENAATLFPFTRHQTLFIPLDNSCYVIADYLKPHPVIEELIKNKVIIRYRDVARQTNCPDWLCLR